MTGAVGGPADAGAVGDATPGDGADSAPPDAGPPPVRLCPDHVLQCRPGEGCTGGVCGGCASADDCRALEGCVGGKCGACGSDKDCKAPKTCLHGFCLRTPLVVWELQVAQAQFDDIVKHPSQEKFIACKLKVEDKLYDQGCQMRIRGGITKYYPKKSFRIEFPEGAENPGYSRKINLRAEYNDPTFMRNLLANYLFATATDIPAPRVRFRRLKVNGADHGIYAEVERIGASYRRKRGKDDQSALYEGDPPNALAIKAGASLVPLPTTDLYKQAYQKHSDPKDDYSDLIALIEQSIWPDHQEGSSARVVKAIDADMYATYLAVHGLVRNGDHVRKNYYFSRQKGAGGQHRWEFWPWDLDMSFGCHWDDEAENNYCDDLQQATSWNKGVVDSGITAGYPNTSGGFYNILIHRFFADPALKAKVAAAMCSLLTSQAWTTKLPKLIDGLEAQLKADVATDPTDRNADLAAFKAAVEAMRAWIKWRTQVMNFDLGCGG